MMRRRKRITPMERTRIHDLLAKGHTGRDVARLVGRSHGVVYRVLHEDFPPTIEKQRPASLGAVGLVKWLQANGYGKAAEARHDAGPADLGFHLTDPDCERRRREVAVAHALKVAVIHEDANDRGGRQWRSLLVLLADTPEEQWGDVADPQTGIWAAWRGHFENRPAGAW